MRHSYSGDLDLSASSRMPGVRQGGVRKARRDQKHNRCRAYFSDWLSVRKDQKTAFRCISLSFRDLSLEKRSSSSMHIALRLFGMMAGKISFSIFLQACTSQTGIWCSIGQRRGREQKADSQDTPDSVQHDAGHGYHDSCMTSAAN